MGDNAPSHSLISAHTQTQANLLLESLAHSIVETRMCLRFSDCSLQGVRRLDPLTSGLVPMTTNRVKKRAILCCLRHESHPLIASNPDA